jgi:hypothetical protein
MDQSGDPLASVIIEQLAELGPKMQAAALLIASTNTVARTFSGINTDLIAIRLDTQCPNAFSSGSFRDLPGLSLLCNVHLDIASPFLIADAIVHEAIHTQIYRYEALGNNRLVSREAINERVCSPWTGRSLRLDSFIQACFVWFGLHHFWDAGAVDDANHSALALRASAGFVNASYVRTCQLHGRYLARGVLDALLSLPKQLH